MKRLVSLIISALIILSGTITAALSFHDVKDGQWYYEVVTEAVAFGLCEGYPNGYFYPDNPVSYAEFVSMAARGRQLAAMPGTAGHWASDIMSAALEAGFYDWDEIPPTGELYDKPIPRKIAARIVFAAYIPNVEGSYSKWAGVIPDFEELDGRYYQPVFALYEAGLAEGDEQGRFLPNESLTRAQACALLVRALSVSGEIKPTQNPDKEISQPVVKDPESSAAQILVSQGGQLQVIGTQLCSQDADPIILRGMSSHGMQWYGNFTSHGAVKTTKDYGANVFRIAMYTKEGGYLDDERVKKSVYEAIDRVIALDMYVVLDWHILSDGNPQTHKDEAKEFFDETAERYAGNPAVIYEICNEPNGNITWQEHIRPYAMEIIPIIRRHSPQAVILVGSGTWSQDIHTVAADPLPFDNVMYTLHFYAGTHRQALRDRLVEALAAGTPVFVSEWGVSDATGGGGVYLQEASLWISLLNQHNISWINWSLCDKNEASAALKPGTSPSGGWKEKDLSESGSFVFSHFSNTN